ncbi:MAG: LuxR C-terminal-related transcriptional regulator, partial [Bacillota bacterium]
YPQLLAGMMLPEEGQDNAEIIQDAVQVAGQADAPGDLGLYAIRTAVHKMAAETDSQTLLYGFLEMAIEQAGADKGYLILEKDETLFVEAMKESDTSIQVPVPPVPLEKSTDLSRRVVRYVARTLEVAVVNDTEHIGVFARDPYLARRRTRSIVCLPLLCRDIPVGVLYLENTQMAGVFTPERVEMLQFLSSQIAYIQKLQSFLETDAGEVRAEKTVPPAVPLTERELEVLNLIAQGMSNKEIARVLFLTVNTVKTHVLKIYEKLQANRRVQAIARARELKLLADN